MSKFKVGDRVRQTRDATDSKAGQIGTVLEDAGYPWVEFDTPTGYRYKVIGATGALSNKAGYCNCVSEIDLELLAPVDLQADMILLLERAVRRVEMANEEGDRILSAWLPEAKALLALAKTKEEAHESDTHQSP